MKEDQVRAYFLDEERHLIENTFVTAGHMLASSTLARASAWVIVDEEGKVLAFDHKVPLERGTAPHFKTQLKGLTP